MHEMQANACENEKVKFTAALLQTANDQWFQNTTF